MSAMTRRGGIGHLMFQAPRLVGGQTSLYGQHGHNGEHLPNLAAKTIAILAALDRASLPSKFLLLPVE